MIRPLVAGIVSLLLLGMGCDSGPEEAENRPTSRPSETGPGSSTDAEELCRGVYERLPQPSREATTEDAFIEKCLAIVSGKPDPGLPPTS